MSEPVSTISKESRAAIDTRFEKDSPHAWLRYSQGHRKHEPMEIPIGRELYTAPRIFVYADKCKSIKEGKNGKPQCFDRFHVEKVRIENGQITGLSIWNDSTNHRCFTWVRED